MTAIEVTTNDARVADDIIDRHTAKAAVAITAGQAIRLNSAEKWILARADLESTAVGVYIATHSVGVNQNLTGVRQGKFAGIDPDLAIGSAVYLSGAVSGGLDDAVPTAQANPSAAPTLDSTGADGSLDAATYSVAYLWRDSVTGRKTLLSPSADIAVSATEHIDVTVPARPSWATHTDVYMNYPAGAPELHYVATGTGTDFNVLAPPDDGAAEAPDTSTAAGVTVLLGRVVAAGVMAVHCPI